MYEHAKTQDQTRCLSRLASKKVINNLHNGHILSFFKQLSIKEIQQDTR